MARKKNGAALAGVVVERVDRLFGGSPEIEVVPSADPDSALDLDLAAETLTGDLRDLILDTLRNEQDKRPWFERSEVQQREAASRIEQATHAWVRKAVELIAAGGRHTIKATIEQVVVKDGIKAVLTMSKFDKLWHNLVDAQGSAVLIVVADSEEFEGERKPVEIRPDQPNLPMAEHSAPDGFEAINETPM